MKQETRVTSHLHPDLERLEIFGVNLGRVEQQAAIADRFAWFLQGMPGSGRRCKIQLHVAPAIIPPGNRLALGHCSLLREIHWALSFRACQYPKV